jgi:hypothetical protein
MFLVLLGWCFGHHERYRCLGLVSLQVRLHQGARGLHQSFKEPACLECQQRQATVSVGMP